MVLKSDLSQELQPIIEDVCGVNTISLCARHAATEARPRKRPQTGSKASANASKRQACDGTATARQNAHDIQLQMRHVRTLKKKTSNSISLQMEIVPTMILCNDKSRERVPV